MRERVCGGTQRVGGVQGYPLNSLYQEVAFVAYHFHWPRSDVLDMEHRERRQWVEEISSINRRINESGQGA